MLFAHHRMSVFALEPDATRLSAKTLRETPGAQHVVKISSLPVLRVPSRVTVEETSQPETFAPPHLILSAEVPLHRFRNTATMPISGEVVLIPLSDMNQVRTTSFSSAPRKPTERGRASITALVQYEVLDGADPPTLRRIQKDL
jgi:hypothetical protein